MEIKVKIKSVFGNELIYPACDKASIFADLCGTKTLNRSDLSNIEKLGYSIQVENAYKLD